MSESIRLPRRCVGVLGISESTRRGRASTCYDGTHMLGIRSIRLERRNWDSSID